MRFFNFSIFILLLLPTGACKKDLALNQNNLETINSAVDRTGFILHANDCLSEVKMRLSNYYLQSNKSSLDLLWFYSGLLPTDTAGLTMFQQKVATQTRNISQHTSLGSLYYLSQKHLISNIIFEHLKETFEQYDALVRSGTNLVGLKSLMALKISSVQNVISLSDQQRNVLLTFYIATSYALSQAVSSSIPDSPYSGNISDRGICEPDGDYSIYDAAWQAGAIALGVAAVVFEYVGLNQISTAIIASVIALTFVVSFVLLCWGDEILCWIFGSQCEPDCTPSSGLTMYPNTCMDVIAQAFGYGSNISMVSIIPIGNCIIPNPQTSPYRAILKPVDPLQPSSASFLSICTDGTFTPGTVVPFNLMAIVPISVPNIYFVNSPTSGKTFQPLRFYVDRSADDLYDITWSVSSSGGVSTSPSKVWADVTFFLNGIFTVTATIKNRCSGTSPSTSTSITIVN
jgi:hypothetical protein